MLAKLQSDYIPRRGQKSAQDMRDSHDSLHAIMMYEA